MGSQWCDTAKREQATRSSAARVSPYMLPYCRSMGWYRPFSSS
jgi:hypothetical protein